MSAIPRAPARGSDWRGAVALARDATTGLADVVEAMHRQIARPWATRPPAGEAARAGGIAGIAYASVRGITRLVGAGADALIAGVGAWAPGAPGGAPAAEREALVAALNGVLGDRLASQGNPLAIPMTMRSRGRSLRLQPASLAAAIGPVGPKLLVLVHGLCMNDLRWSRDGHDHGDALARALGYTPVYLHYNTGLHICANGRTLAGLMAQLLTHWPVPLEEVTLLTHSMGGLVARSALQQGAAAGQRWVDRVDRLVFLGTPHHGAPLERSGHGLDLLLDSNRFSAPLARLSRLRSAGITDLRRGDFRDADPAGRGRSAGAGRDTGQPTPLPASVACFTIAALAGGHAGDLRSRLIGDGLVPLDSALGRHADPGLTLAFPPQRQWVAEGVNHLQLLSDPTVAARLVRWLTPPAR